MSVYIVGTTTGTSSCTSQKNWKSCEGWLWQRIKLGRVMVTNDQYIFSLRYISTMGQRSKYCDPADVSIPRSCLSWHQRLVSRYVASYHINLFQEELIASNLVGQSCHASRFLLLLRCLESSSCCIDLAAFSRKLLGQIVCAECYDIVRQI
jgi:hypothetical protein